jgi:uncharacterized protein YndB with AHSA1/START domain
MAAMAIPVEAVIVKRTFAAPREKVFAAWSDPALMARWFCRCVGHPPTRVLEAELRSGGSYRIEVEGPQQGAPGSTLYRGWGVYREVRPPERLVFTWNWEHDEFQDTLVTVEFHALGESGFTEVTLTHELLPTEKARAEHRKGWGECFDMLERTLKGEEF